VNDNGPDGKGQFSALLKQHGIEHVEIPSGQPSTNGMSERSVHILREALRKLVMSMGSLRWNECMPFHEFGSHITQENDTELSPYFLLYRRTWHRLTP
jgi:transposase InsO family protein